MKKRKQKLPITEELDFSYLLSLMRPLHNVDEFAWLPELFSLVGHESLIDLCKYAGGETIKIPTIEQLSQSIVCLQHFYKIYIQHQYTLHNVEPENKELVMKIRDIYNAQEG